MAGDQVGAAETEDDGREDRCEQASMDHDVGQVLDRQIKNAPGGGEACKRDAEALAAREGEDALQLAERGAGEKRAEVGQRRVFEELDVEAAGVAVCGAGEVVGVEDRIGGVGDEADDPDGEKKSDQPGGFGRPWKAHQQREHGVEGDLAGERPGDGVPEGGEVGEPALEKDEREEGALPEIVEIADVPLGTQHFPGADEDEEVDGIEAGKAGDPEFAVVEGPGRSR